MNKGVERYQAVIEEAVLEGESGNASHSNLGLVKNSRKSGKVARRRGWSAEGR